MARTGQRGVAKVTAHSDEREFRDERAFRGGQAVVPDMAGLSGVDGLSSVSVRRDGHAVNADAVDIV